MKTRDYWKAKARKSKDPLHWSASKNFHREVKREIRMAEREFATEQIINNKNNTNSIWKRSEHAYQRSQHPKGITAKMTRPSLMSLTASSQVSVTILLRRSKYWQEKLITTWANAPLFQKIIPCQTSSPLAQYHTTK